MPAQSQINHIIHFPEGDFLIVNGSPYFLPQGDDTAYLGWGARKELLGKIHHEIETRSPDFKKFDLTYEIEDGQLIAARLITPFNRSAGTLADDATKARLNKALQDGSLTLAGRANPPFICRAARFGDGRLLILAENLNENSRHTLFVGNPGDLKEVPITNGVQGGCSFYYQTTEGKKVALPYGLGGPTHEPPEFGEEILAYIEVKDSYDLEAFGIKTKLAKPHLDPFAPELQGPKPN